jgi:hypothetical protein
MQANPIWRAVQLSSLTQHNTDLSLTMRPFPSLHLTFSVARLHRLVFYLAWMSEALSRMSCILTILVVPVFAVQRFVLHVLCTLTILVGIWGTSSAH